MNDRTRAGAATGAPAEAASRAATGAPEDRKPVEAPRTTLGNGIRIDGDIAGRGDVLLRGTVAGNFELPGHGVTVARAGRVEGTILANRVQIEGKVVGEIRAADRLDIRSTGAVQGTIVARRLRVEDGATFRGRIDMNVDDGPAAAAHRVRQR